MKVSVLLLFRRFFQISGADFEGHAEYVGRVDHILKPSPKYSWRLIPSSNFRG